MKPDHPGRKRRRDATPYGAPVAVQIAEGFILERPNGQPFYLGVYSDGSLWTGNGVRLSMSLTMAEVRQVAAELEFGGSGWERFNWQIAKERANTRATALDGEAR